MSVDYSNVLTVFFHGTAFSRDTDPGEVITQLSNAIKGNEARIVKTGAPTKEFPLPYKLESPYPTFLICEGPGSEAVSAVESKSGVAHDRPGVYNPLLNTNKRKENTLEINPSLVSKGGRAYWLLGSQKSSEFQDHFMGNTETNWRFTGGQFLGRGWNDNVYKAVWLLTLLNFEQGMPIDTVNLVGWSRGAVTCLKTANKIFEVFEDTINVNIFAIDPVPGGLNKVDDDLRLIPPNVRNYLGILALDENGSMFEAMDRISTRLMAPRSQYGKAGNPDSLNPFHLKPKVHFLPFPGNHADLVNAGSPSGPVLDSSKMILHLACKFLSRHGTDFKYTFNIDNLLAKGMYASLFKNMEAIAKKSRIWLINSHGRKKERHVSKHREAYVSEPEKYLNEHHRLLELGENYPSLQSTGEKFTKDEWTDWNANQTIDEWSEWSGGKSLDLTKEQADLRTMGI